MHKRKRILIIGDQPGWAFHNIIKFIQSHLEKSFDFYFDFVLYNSAYEDPNREISSRSNQNFKYSRKLLFQNVFFIKGIEYRLIRYLNRLNCIDFNEHGKFQRVRDDNTYDIVLYLDYYFLYDGDFKHVIASKIIQGTFSDVFPPRKLVRMPQSLEIIQNTDGRKFCDTFLVDADALLIGAPNIKEKYLPYFIKPIFFANMAYNERRFKIKNFKKSVTDKFVIGWTGNPDREFKGFHSHVIPTIEKLISLGYLVELKTQFEGSIKSLISFWQDVDLAFIASTADAGPSMFMEASLCGVPTISTRIGMPNYVIIDGINGLFCSRDINDMVEKITFIINDKKLYLSMRSRIRKDYIEKLGVKVQVQNWNTLFNEVLKNA